MGTAYLILRWVHVVAAAAWFGEVVTINFVLVPAVNDHPAWIQGAADLVRRTGSGYAPPP